MDLQSIPFVHFGTRPAFPAMLREFFARVYAGGSHTSDTFDAGMHHLLTAHRPRHDRIPGKEASMVPYHIGRSVLAAAAGAFCLLFPVYGGSAFSTPHQPAGTQPAKPDQPAKPGDAEKKPDQQNTQQPDKKPADSSPPAPPPANPAPKPQPGDPSLNDPSVDQIIKDMDKPKAPLKPVGLTSKPAVEPPGTKARAGGAGDKVKLLREGTFLTSRRGRMVRSSAGDWEYVFDADAQGNADPAMVLMPCLNLAGMEKTAEKRGESTTFTVTGQVFVYHNRNYLLPTIYQINRPERDIRTTQ